MNFDYTDEQKQLRKSLVEFAQSELENEHAAERYEKQEFPRDLWNRCAAHRLHGLSIAPEFGGAGLDGIDNAIAMEAFGYGCEDGGLVFAIGAHHYACTVPIAKFASAELKRKYLPKLCDGAWIGVNAMTEPSGGSDIASIETTAVRDGDDYVLNGTKSFGTNSPDADIALVFAVTNPDATLQSRLTPFIVEKQTDGFKVTKRYAMMGHRTTPIGEIVFENVRVPKTNMVGAKEGAGVAIFNHAMNWERVNLFAAHVGAMQRLLERSIRYSRRRKQSGQPVSKFQGVSHKIADMKVRLEAARLLVLKAASRLDKFRDVALDASIAKLFTSEAFIQSASDALQIHGGSGYLCELGIERDLRDAHGSTLYSGTSEIQRNIIAGWLGL